MCVRSTCMPMNYRSIIDLLYKMSRNKCRVFSPCWCPLRALVLDFNLPNKPWGYVVWMFAIRFHTEYLQCIIISPRFPCNSTWIEFSKDKFAVCFSQRQYFDDMRIRYQNEFPLPGYRQHYKQKQHCQQMDIVAYFVVI